MTIVFLTVGELPSPTGLIASQVFELMVELKKRDYDVLYVGVIPLASFIKDKFLRKGQNYNSTVDYLNKANIEYYLWLSLLRLASSITFLFKKYLLKKTVKRVLKCLKSDRHHIFHCRSYYASYIANKVKQNALKLGINVKVVFDLRSILTIELPYLFRRLGVFLYGPAKAWEHELLHNSDLSLMTTQKGIRLLELEHGKNPNIKYIPNTGFKRDNYVPDINYRWNSKKIGFVGRIGEWHTDESISKYFDFLNSIFCDCEHVIVSTSVSYRKEFPHYHFKSLNYSEMKNHYKQLLALIVPGDILNTTNFFKSMQMRVNLFSTKAAEALSMGVPLIVNSNIGELAELVIKSRCGLILDYNSQTDRLVLQDYTEDDLRDFKFWKELTENAYSVGKTFTRESVISKYVGYWENLYDNTSNPSR